MPSRQARRRHFKRAANVTSKLSDSESKDDKTLQKEREEDRFNTLYTKWQQSLAQERRKQIEDAKAADEAYQKFVEWRDALTDEEHADLLF